MKRMTRTLPLLGALALVGTAAGVSLGHSAVSEINPLYFGETPDRFHADQVPLRPVWTEAQPALADASTVQGLGDGCLGCGPPSEVYGAAPAVITYTDDWTAQAERAAEPMGPSPVDEIAPDPERERVILYASYPVSAEDAQAERTETEAFAVAAAEVE